VNRIVILGGGSAGLSVARALRFVHAQVTLVDRRDSHLFQATLYAAAVSRPRRLQAGLAQLLHGQENVQLVRSEALYLDARQRRLILADRALPYDTLVVAAGSRPRYQREEWRRTAPSLKSPEDALRVREKLRDRDTAVVIVGGGVTGVELASAVARMDRSRRVVLVETGRRVLAGFPQRSAREGERLLQHLGVEIRYGLHVIGIDEHCVRASGEQGPERILSRAVLWAGGVEGAGFGEALRGETGVPLDETGRVCVHADLSVAGHPEIFVIGDLARVLHDGVPLDGLATVAAQQGRYVAAAIRERMTGYDARPFEYTDQGRFAILGRGGVGAIGDTELSGAAAWLAAKLAQKWSAPGPFMPQLRVYSAATGSKT
jgi:NADH:ubiquinone reductase (H+-translocating)